MIDYFAFFRKAVKEMRTHQKIYARTNSPASSNAARRSEEAVDEQIEFFECFDRISAERARLAQPELI